MEGRARRAKSRSMSMPANVHLMIGTKAFGTDCRERSGVRSGKKLRGASHGAPGRGSRARAWDSR